MDTIKNLFRSKPKIKCLICETLYQEPTNFTNLSKLENESIKTRTHIYMCSFGHKFIIYEIETL